MEKNSVYSGSATSTVTGRSLDFKAIITQPVTTVSLRHSFLQIISQAVVGFAGLCKLHLVYYYCGIYGAIAFTTWSCFQILIIYVVKCSCNSVVADVQRRFLAEQFKASQVIFEHAIIIGYVFGIVISLTLGLLNEQIDTKFTKWLDTQQYLKIMLKVMPILSTIYNVPLPGMVAENRSDIVAFISIAKELISTIAVYMMCTICKGSNKTISMNSFAIIEIVITSVFIIVVYYILAKADSSSRFSLTFSSFKDLKMTVLIEVLLKTCNYMVSYITDNILPLLALISLQLSTGLERLGGILSLGIMLQFQQFCVCVAQSVESVVIQVSIPNNQLKRFDRMSTLLKQGMLQFLVISIVINLIMYVSFNQLLTMVYQDLSYSSLTHKFNNQNYSTDALYSAKLIAIESMLRPLYQFVTSMSFVCGYKIITVFLIILKSIIHIIMIIICFTIKTMNELDLIIYAMLFIDILCVYPYIFLSMRFKKLRGHMQEIDQLVNDNNQDLETETTINMIEPIQQMPTIQKYNSSSKSNSVEAKGLSEFESAKLVQDTSDLFKQAYSRSNEVKSQNLEVLRTDTRSNEQSSEKKETSQFVNSK
ncbi:MatE_and transmembrane domain-containing protein [Hexamita inflata]|uniref:MatE and transmembrane domain-containing protein n=1 Tax=Hexamita inflata TaxID=28002 RepID=A0AA86NXF3_9EUKA|nr:MatE and transmembrane domain-containing protein [Hexamita inflata]CAI9928417.1 MatE and transmembrane domain-containing protein [Hexamita inflata]CAI9954862.1 MatE and transmembrane domain-containing protein [Hexamita inflata]